MRALRMIGGLGAGVVCATGIARLALGTLQAAWPEYAAALPQKEFTLPMLLSRLSIAVLLTVASASAATLVAGDRRASWMLGCLIVVVSLPSHLHYSWADYPLWYHAVYLVSIVPLAVLGGRLVPIRLSSPTPVTPRSVKRGNMSQIRIRAERQADHERVFEIEQSAFGGQIQANLVEALRESANPSLSLVADLNHKIVGHIFFSPVTLDGTRSPAAAQLSPVAVDPEFQGQGIGSALIRAGIEQSPAKGWVAIFLVGNPLFYSRFGFEMAKPRGHSCSGPHDPFLQVLDLAPGALHGVTGHVEFHPAFAEIEGE